MFEIKLLYPEHEEAYSRFLRSDDETNVFSMYASLEYRDFLQEVVAGEPCYLIALKGGEIAGVLPYFKKTDEEFGAVINSLPWFGSHGGCILRDGADSGCRRALLEAFNEKAAEPGLLSATMILNPVETRSINEYLSVNGTAVKDSRIGQITHLPASGGEVEEDLLKTFNQKTRNLVRKSVRQDFTVSVTDEERAWRFLHEMHQDNIQARGGVAKPWSHFLALRKNFPQGKRRLYVAMDKDEPVAALLLLYFNKTVEYFVPVIKAEHRSKQPLSFLIFRAMIDAVKQGYKWWNWGGTWASQESLYHFKAGFGAAEMPYTYIINASKESLKTIGSRRDDVVAAFPFYYIYPFGLLKES